jgi:hypothetical protein
MGERVLEQKCSSGKISFVLVILLVSSFLPATAFALDAVPAETGPPTPVTHDLFAGGFRRRKSLLFQAKFSLLCSTSVQLLM